MISEIKRQIAELEAERQRKQDEYLAYMKDSKAELKRLNALKVELERNAIKKSKCRKAEEINRVNTLLCPVCGKLPVYRLINNPDMSTTYRLSCACPEMRGGVEVLVLDRNYREAEERLINYWNTWVQHIRAVNRRTV